MKKSVLLLFLLIIIFLMLPSCSDVTGIIASEEVSDDDTVSKSYSAADTQNLHIFVDYDNVTSLCNDAFEEFFRAVKQGDHADFSPYIDNETLNMYMQYRVKNHIFGYSIGTRCKFLITEVTFSDEYALIKGQFFTYNSSINSEAGEGVATFIVKNYNGRLVITEWYWPSMHSLDFKYRNNFSAEDNLDYWENESKYYNLISHISSEDTAVQ